VKLKPDGTPLTEADIIEFPSPGQSAPQPEDDPGAAPPSGDAGDDEPQPDDDRTPPPPARDDGLVDIQLGGKTVKVTSDVADAYRAEINRRDGIRGNELQKLREEVAFLKGQRTAAPPPAPTREPEPVGPKLPDPALNITDPDEYQRQLVAYTEARVKAEVSAAEERARAEMAQATEEQRRAAEWAAHVDRFYKNNPELEGARDVVDAVWNAKKLGWKDLSVEDAFAELATVSKARLAELARAGKVVGARTKPPAVEGSRARPSAAPASAPDSEPRTITSFLRERRAAQRAAMTRPPAKAASR
jgi:hypothetical protein